MSECMGLYKVCETPCTLVQVCIQNAYEVKYTPGLLSYNNITNQQVIKISAHMCFNCA